MKGGFIGAGTGRGGFPGQCDRVVSVEVKTLSPKPADKVEIEPGRSNGRD